MPKSVQDRLSMIKLSKNFQIYSFEKFSMSKMHRGSKIENTFYHGHNFCYDPSRFSLILIKHVGHQLSTMSFLSSLKPTPPPIFYRFQKENRLSRISLCANKNFLFSMSMEINARRLRFSEWFFFLL
jgi:hypothetical protein